MRYRHFRGSRLFALFVLFMSIVVWFPVQHIHGNLSELVSVYTKMAVLLGAGFVGFQVYKSSVEKRYWKLAVSELNAAWNKV